jgi:hypothetical protein
MLEPPIQAALFVYQYGRNHSWKVFNTTVDNSVEKRGSIVVSDSAKAASALCTGASAGTFVVRLAIQHAAVNFR